MLSPSQGRAKAAHVSGLVDRGDFRRQQDFRVRSRVQLGTLVGVSSSPTGSMPGDTWTEASQAQGDCRSPSPFWCRWCRQDHRVLNRALKWLGQEREHMASRSSPATLHAGPAVQPENLAVSSWRLLAVPSWSSVPSIGTTELCRVGRRSSFSKLGRLCALGAVACSGCYPILRYVHTDIQPARRSSLCVACLRA
jgi:hypothetical protein